MKKLWILLALSLCWAACSKPETPTPNPDKDTEQPAPSTPTDDPGKPQEPAEPEVKTATLTLDAGNPNFTLGGPVTVQSTGLPKEPGLGKLFDQDPATDFMVEGKTFDLIWECKDSLAVNWYGLTSSASGDAKEDPKYWSFYGSMDKENWTLLDKQGPQTFARRGDRIGCKFENEVAWAYYKLSVELNNGGNATRLAEVLVSMPYTLQVPAEGTKFLTSGTVTVEFSNMGTDMAFDKAIDNNQDNAWVIYHKSFSVIWAPDKNTKVESYTLRSAPAGRPKTCDPKSWRFLGSDNKEDWTLLDEQKDHEYTNRKQAKKCVIENPKYYSYYKWEILDNNGADVTSWGEMAVTGTMEREPNIPQTLEEVIARGFDHNDVSVSPLGDMFEQGVKWINNGNVTAEELAWLADPNATMLTYQPEEFPKWKWKKVENMANMVLYPHGKPVPADVNQHSIGDCSMLAAFASLAYHYPEFIMSIIKDNGDSTFDVKMYDPKGKPITVTLSARFLANANGAWQCVTGKNGKLTWATLLEKAIMKWNMVYKSKNSLSMYGIGPAAGIAPFTGDGRAFSFARGRLLPEELRAAVKILLDKGFIITNGFGKEIPIDGGKTITLHSFTVMHANKPGPIFQVRNPWGYNPGRPDNDGIYYIGNFTPAGAQTVTVQEITDIMDFRIMYPGDANPNFSKSGATEPYYPPVSTKATGDYGIRMDEYFQRMANGGRLTGE